MQVTSSPLTCIPLRCVILGFGFHSSGREFAFCARVIPYNLHLQCSRAASFSEYAYYLASPHIKLESELYTYLAWREFIQP